MAVRYSGLVVKPELIVHCDWSTSASKRWVAAGQLSSTGCYEVTGPILVGGTDLFFSRLRGKVPTGTILAGFDFPMGVPRAYAERAGFGRFPDMLLRLGEGPWADFYKPAARPDEISLARPFYPRTAGGTRKQHLVDGLGLRHPEELLRQCERRTALRGNACVIFWTLGANQVGRAAIQGWRDLLAPAVRDRSISIWPFDGELPVLLASDGITVVETYPAETYGHLGLPRGFGKRSRKGRSGQARAILAWCERNAIRLKADLAANIERGFGDAETGEDAFDALIGLLGMIEVVCDPSRCIVPQDAAVRGIEGWILGTEPASASLTPGTPRNLDAAGDWRAALNQDWFEMTDVRKRKLDNAVWIPLRVNSTKSVGEHGHSGFRSETFAVGSVAVLFEEKSEAEKLGWGDLSLAQSHKGRCQGGRYLASDIFDNYRGGQAIRLVLDQEGNREEPRAWHLHQDFVVTLGLKREGNVWLAIDEGYIEVAHLRVGADDEPDLLEVRAEHLKDYLCARGMALYVSSYRLREEVVDDASHIQWPSNPFARDLDRGDRWEGRLQEIHEGGQPFGGSICVAHLSRTDVDFAEDVPRISPGDDAALDSWTKKYVGRKLHLVRGELWRNEWVEPAKHSPRVRGDELPASVFFTTDSSGTRESRETLIGGGRWLWFRPDVIMDLAHRRGGALWWHTRDTGSVRCSPDYSVHFGVNSLGLVTVYAKDVALLPEWQQRLWAGFNVSPEGGVSEELFAAQAEGNPADTQSPEEFLPKAIELINRIGTEKFGFPLFREHEQFRAVIARAHRFRSIDKNGFFSLAKDLARVTSDTIDASALQKIAPPPKGEKWGSLKSLENVVALHVGKTSAYSLLGPLHGIYNLRHADAHLAGSDLDAAFTLVGVDQKSPFVSQGYQLLHSCVSALHAIAEVLGQLKGRDSSQG